MIESIPDVIFDGESSFPYAIDFSYGGSEKSELTLNFVDKVGDLNSINKYQRDSGRLISVVIGPFFRFSGYTVAANIKAATEGGVTYSIKMQDSSIILDKYFVGLKGVWGNGFTTTATGNYGNLILLGKQIDPCKNMPPNSPDPCAPLCSDQEDRQDFNCIEERQLKILEVDYSFPELQAAVAGVVRFGQFPQGINTEYRANYTGTLREVIKSWCQDFAIDFYWDDNAIYFYDLSTGINIDDSQIDSTHVISQRKSFSIEGNFTQGNIISFTADGEKREYSCSRNSSKGITLRPITLLDVLEDNSDTNGKPGYSFLVRNYDPNTFVLQKSKKCLFESIILNYYSENFRNLYILFENQNLDTVQKMKDFAASTKKGIPSLGGFKPTRVCHAAQKDVVSENESYNIYKTLLSRLTANEALDFVNRGGYFVAADYNKTQHEYFINFEKKLGENFFGKYWIRAFNGENYTFNAPDGDVKYYSNGSEIQFPFLEYLPVDIKATSDFIEDLVGEYDPTKPDKAHGNFLFMERTATWVPSQTADSMQKIIQELEPFSIKEIGNEDVNGVNVLKAGQTWFQVFPRPKGLDLDIANRTKEDKNPYDAKNVNLNTTFNGITATYGLNSSLTQAYAIKTPSSLVPIYLPSQAGPYEGTHYAGYTVLANGAQFTNEYSAIIPKAEYVLGAVPPTSNKDTGMQIQFRDASQTLLELIKVNGQQSCGYDENKIQALLAQFNSRFNNPVSVEREEREYEISNIPASRFTAKNGLQSFSMSYSDQGVRTTLTFSNLPKSHKSDAVTLEEFKKQNTLKRAKNYYVQT